MKLTRKVAFSSGHRYWRDDWTPEHNRQVFGEWASPYNHGHNYALEVTISGRINDESSMVINIKELDIVMKERIVRRVAGKSINDEVEEFHSITPTTENIALFMRKALHKLPQEVVVTKVRLYETDTLFAEVSGTDKEARVQLTRVYEFSAAHRLHADSLSPKENLALFGKCNNPAGHGHNYVLEVTVEGIPDSETGMVADIGTIDEVVEREVVGRYDHKHLNEDIPEFRGANPTTEVLTRTIWQRLDGRLPVKLSRIVVRETARNFFEYSGEDE